jgi:PAS domain S-box-containing protein
METGEDDAARYRAVFEHAIDAMVVGDDDGRCVDANPAACNLYGVSHDDLVGRRLDEFLDADDGEAFRRALRDDARPRGRVSLRRADGTRRHVEYAVSHASQPDDHVVTLRDVTEQVERERQFVHEIERLDQFASMVSHDLQSPVDAAIGHLDLYHERDETAHYEAARRAMERIANLSTELLALVQEDDVAGDRTDLSLAAVAEEVWAETDTRDATLEVTDATIAANERRLHILLSNLFRNAVGHGGYDVTVRVGPLERVFDGEGFYVEDTGRGIPAEHREKVLEYGFSTGYGGSGVGLTIVQQVAAANGWTVDLTESAEGGARFEFRTG